MNKKLSFAIFQLIASIGLFNQYAIARENQGVNDYAKAHWSVEQSCVPFVRKYESVCGSSFETDKSYEKNDKERAKKYDTRSNTNSCDKLNLESKPNVEKGQVISIYLQQTFIEDFTERWGEIFGRKRGEIAIVARVAELSDSTDFDFTNAGRDRGRLVYYSEGVQPRQFLNFSQLPIYGPIEYTGKPLVLEFYIIELDVKENTEISGLLSAAAGLGATAYPPASPVLKVLDTIGGGLLKSNSSDLEFKYHAALLAQEKQILNIKSGVLEYGNYAFVRMPPMDRNDPSSTSNHRWSNWWFNQKNARIYEDKDCSRPLLTQTYLTLQVNRASEQSSLDLNNTFLNFVNKITTEASAGTALPGC